MAVNVIRFPSSTPVKSPVARELEIVPEMLSPCWANTTCRVPTPFGD